MDNHSGQYQLTNLWKFTAKASEEKHLDAYENTCRYIIGNVNTARIEDEHYIDEIIETLGVLKSRFNGNEQVLSRLEKIKKQCDSVTETMENNFMQAKG